MFSTDRRMCFFLRAANFNFRNVLCLAFGRAFWRIAPHIFIVPGTASSYVGLLRSMDTSYYVRSYM